MSPTRIGSIVLLVLVDPRDAVLVADLDQLDVPLGLLGGDARRIRGEDGHLHLGAGPLVAIDVDLDLAAVEIDEGDVAVGLVEDVHVLVELVASARG